MNRVDVQLSVEEIRDLISALWNRVVYLETQWRAMLAENRLEPARVLHGKLMDAQSLIRHLERFLPE